MSNWRIREAGERDMGGIRALLVESALPTDDLETSRPAFLLAHQDSAIVGVGGYERFGETGLLRSVAVRTSHRGTGLGRTIVRDLEERVLRRGINEFVLLTDTARAFFEAQGYRVIERDAAPLPVQRSVEFKSLCPTSACCMFKSLRHLTEPSGQ